MHLKRKYWICYGCGNFTPVTDWEAFLYMVLFWRKKCYDCETAMEAQFIS